MQGTIYISQIPGQFSFEVYNLYPDYVFPGKIKRVEVTITGAANEEKQGTVILELHALDNYLEGAKYAFTRIFSEVDTFFDLYMYPTGDSVKVGTDENGSDVNVGTVLKGTFTLASNVKQGYWSPRNITLTDQAGNKRNEGKNDFGWRMYVTLPMRIQLPQNTFPILCLWL